MPIVYMATNIITGKKYIGITKQALNGRKKGHRHNANKMKNHPFYNTWRKYGEENFVWEILKECEDINEAVMLEERYIGELNTISPNGYNLMAGGLLPPNMKGRPKSEEHKRKIGEANKGKTIDEETRKKLIERLKGHTPWNKGKKNCQVAWNKGKEHSEETRKKISIANKGKTPWNKGIPRSPETIKKIRESKRIRKLLLLNQHMLSLP